MTSDLEYLKKVEKQRQDEMYPGWSKLTAGLGGGDGQ